MIKLSYKGKHNRKEYFWIAPKHVCWVSKEMIGMDDNTKHNFLEDAEDVIALIESALPTKKLPDELIEKAKSSAEDAIFIEKNSDEILLHMAAGIDRDNAIEIIKSNQRRSRERLMENKA